MNEKAKALNIQEYGKDLEGVQSLIMRHQELEKDLTAIEDKLEVIFPKGRLQSSNYYF